MLWKTSEWALQTPRRRGGLAEEASGTNCPTQKPLCDVGGGPFVWSGGSKARGAGGWVMGVRAKEGAVLMDRVASDWGLDFFSEWEEKHWGFWGNGGLKLMTQRPRVALETTCSTNWASQAPPLGILNRGMTWFAPSYPVEKKGL